MEHGIVIIEARSTGLHLVKNLRGADCDITPIDRRNHHLF